MLVSLWNASAAALLCLALGIHSRRLPFTSEPMQDNHDLQFQVGDMKDARIPDMLDPLAVLLLHLAPVTSSLVVRQSSLKDLHPRGWRRSKGIASAADGDEDNANVAEAAQSFFNTKRSVSGPEAFEGTSWSVLLLLDEGGSTIFTVALNKDGSCQFSDKFDMGTWQAKQDFVAIEKPKGLFENTLVLSARISPPMQANGTWRLVDGLVHSSAPPGQVVKSGKDSESNDSGDKQSEVKQIGTFTATEFSNSLYTGWGRFRGDDSDEASDSS